MCGIIGVILAPGLEPRRMKSYRDTIRQLMLAAQERGGGRRRADGNTA